MLCSVDEERRKKRSRSSPFVGSESTFTDVIPRPDWIFSLFFRWESERFAMSQIREGGGGGWERVLSTRFHARLKFGRESLYISKSNVLEMQVPNPEKLSLHSLKTNLPGKEREEHLKLWISSLYPTHNTTVLFYSILPTLFQLSFLLSLLELIPGEMLHLLIF